MPQLAFALRRQRGGVPVEIREAGRLGPRHISALISLAVAGPATVTELGERLGMSTAHASLVVGELADAGLIDRKHDERDRRRIIVSVSDKAKPAVAEMRSRNSAPLRRFLAELDEDEADRFIDQLTALIAYIREEPADGSRVAADGSRVAADGSRVAADGSRVAADGSRDA